jgi:hypothetical protein
MIVCHQKAACIEKHRYVVELSAPDRSPFSSMCLQESTFSLDFSFHDGLSRACLGKNDGIFKHKTAPKKALSPAPLMRRITVRLVRCLFYDVT